MGDIMENTEIFLCLKINKQKWINALKDGVVCFNPVDVFIKKAEETGNNEQGDKFEGIFARLRNDDPRVEKIKKQFSSDIETIEDGEFTMFRRPSSRLVPVFCMYGIKKEDLVFDENSIFEKNGETFTNVSYSISDKMYTGFLDDDGIFNEDTWGYYCSAGHFQDSLEEGLRGKKLHFEKVLIKYDIDLNREFYIMPTDDYRELWHKRKDLEYQQEVRYLLSKSLTSDKILVPYKPLSAHSSGVASGAIYMNITLKLEPNS